MRRSAVIFLCITGLLIRAPPHWSRRRRVPSGRTFSDPTFPLRGSLKRMDWAGIPTIAWSTAASTTAAV